MAFKNIPSTLRTPGFYFETDNSQANTASGVSRTLIIGQMLTGTATANVPAPSPSISDAKVAFGVGAMLNAMVAWYRRRDPSADLWCLPLADDAGGAAATGTVTITGPATASGVLSLYIGGVLVPVAVTSGQTAAQIASAIVAAVSAFNPPVLQQGPDLSSSVAPTLGALTELPVTAAAVAAVVTFTARNKGLCGNDIDLRANYLGAAGGQVLPAGVGVTFTAMSGGATNPLLTNGLAALGDMPFDVIVCPYTDAGSLNAMQALMGDTSGRWSWTTQTFGGVFSAFRGTLGTRTTFGLTRNDQHMSIISFNDSPTPAYLWAANYAAACAASLRSNPATPLQTLVLDVLAPPIASRDTQAARNSLLYDGLATYIVDSGGTVRIDSAITTYQTNAFGQVDDSYLQVETLYTLAAVIQRLRAVLSSKYARVNIADDNTFIPPGASAVTPKMIKSDIVAAARQMEGVLLDDVDDIAEKLVVTRNVTNPRRVDVLFPPTLLKGLSILAVQAQFR